MLSVASKQGVKLFFDVNKTKIVKDNWLMKKIKK